MKARISVITLGVDDLGRAVRFYRDGLGLRTEGIVGRDQELGAVACCFLYVSGLRDFLVKAAGTPATDA